MVKPESKVRTTLHISIIDTGRRVKVLMKAIYKIILFTGDVYYAVQWFQFFELAGKTMPKCDSPNERC